jgi:hypothetical protein
MAACAMEFLFNVIPQVLSVVLFYFNMSTARFGPINSTLVGMEGFVTGGNFLRIKFVFFFEI